MLKQPSSKKRRKIVVGTNATTNDDPNSISSSAVQETESGMLAKASQYAEQDQFINALSLLGIICARKATTCIEPKILEMKAQCHLQLGDYFAAIQACEQAIQNDNNYGYAWLTLARAQRNFGEPGLAVESFRSAIEYIENDLDSRNDAKLELEEVLGFVQQSDTDGGMRFKVMDKVQPTNCTTIEANLNATPQLNSNET